jgi:hypothetical protein
MDQLEEHFEEMDSGRTAPSLRPNGDEPRDKMKEILIEIGEQGFGEIDHGEHITNGYKGGLKG